MSRRKLRTHSAICASATANSQVSGSDEFSAPTGEEPNRSSASHSHRISFVQNFFTMDPAIETGGRSGWRPQLAVVASSSTSPLNSARTEYDRL